MKQWLSVLGLVCVAQATSFGAMVWNAGSNFVANEIPNGPQETINPNPTVPQWSYGHRSAALSTALTLYTPSEHVNGGGHPDLQGYSNGSSMVANTGSGAVVLNNGFGPLGAINPGEMLLHPSSGLEMPVMRFTVPSSGSWDISAQWTDVDPYGGNGVTAWVVINGVVMFTEVMANGGAASTSQTVTLAAGDVVDFLVDAKGDFAFDSTRFNATVIPEPSSLVLGAMGAVLGLRRRRR